MREHELLLWTMLEAVEAHTLSRYAAVAPVLHTEAKRSAVADISALLPSHATLVGTPLQDAVQRLLQTAAGDGSRRDALWNQGLVLETLGSTIYRTFAQQARLSPTGQAVAEKNREASVSTAWACTARLRAEHPDTNERFYAFARRTDALFVRLDALGEALDDVFSKPFDLRFSDVMGEFVAELLPSCTSELGFARRKVMMHLTTALMA